MSYFLSVCIPTYNGVENLKYNINKLIKMQQEYNFEICVSDNASYDNTQQFMIEIVSKYNFIKYHRNEKNYGMAYNFDYVLNMATGEYRWLLGDDDEIVEENLGKVIQALKEHKPDICVVNGYDGKICIEKLSSNFIYNKNDVLSLIGFYMSWISALVFSKSSLKQINIKKENSNAFPHLISMFRYLNIKCQIYWLDKICIQPQEKLQRRYSNKIIIYFLKDWYEVVEKIGDFSIESKNEFVLHSPLAKMRIIDVLGHRKNNVINKKVYDEIRPVLQFYPQNITYKLYFVCFIPVLFLKILVKFLKIMKVRS